MQRLLKSVTDANALGDLDGLRGRLEALTGKVDARREEVKAAREQARSEARDVKERIVEEAERIAAEATHWKAAASGWPSCSRSGRPRRTPTGRSRPCCGSGCPPRATRSPSAARPTSPPWRPSGSRSGPARRSWSQEAEALADSTDWGPTSSAYRDLMRQWKEAGRARRDDEAELWKRFRDAQDKFFAARSEVFAAKETELRAHATVKEQLLAEAQELLPVTDWRAARSALRGIQERWEQAGPVPRESRGPAGSRPAQGRGGGQAGRGGAVERSNPEALARAEGTVSQLRSAIESLETQLTKAQARGTPAASARPRRHWPPGAPGWRRPSGRWRSSPAERGLLTE